MAIRFIKALENTLLDLKQPVVSDYNIFVSAYRLDAKGAYKAQQLHRQATLLSRHKVSSLIRELKQNKVIKNDPDFPVSVYRINEMPDGTNDEICAIVDPFCYLSHLTAMRRFGLTERIPSSLIVTTPRRELWNTLRDQLVENELPGLDKAFTIIHLKQSSFPSEIRGFKVHRHETKYPAAVVKIQDSLTRISSIGSTFADMLDKPSLCGGMEHVLEVWKEHAKSYIEEIIASVTTFPKKLVKVRAGYIMDELLHVTDDRIKLWLTSAQRGSSQVLDPEKPFKSTFSEKWMLSLNV